MSTATWVREALDEQGVAYQELHHPEAYTAQEVAQREHFTGHHVAKVVVVMAGEKPVEVVIPASRRVDVEGVREALGAGTARLATEDEMGRYFSDCELGAIPPLRHWRNVEVLMDAALRTEGDILFQAGTHRDSVRMHFDDWFRLVQPRVGVFAEPFPPGPRQVSFEEKEREP